MYTGFVHREVCGNTCKLWRYVCIQVLYTERFVIIHANCGDMYVYRFCTQRGLYTYISPEICMYTGFVPQRGLCGNTCKPVEICMYTGLHVCTTERSCGNACKPVEICMYTGLHVLPQRGLCGNTCKHVEICMYTGLHVLPQRGLVVMHANLWRYVCIQVCMYYHREVSVVHTCTLWRYVCIQVCMYYHREVLW